VLVDSQQFTVQYVSARGLLDLRADKDIDPDKSISSRVRYGVDPSTVTLIAGAAPPSATATAPQHLEHAGLAGSHVLFGGERCKVQYVTSRTFWHRLDLQLPSGDVQYGVDPAAVTVLDDGGAEPSAIDPPPALSSAPPVVVSSAVIEPLGERLSRVMGSGASVFRCHMDGGPRELACKLLPCDAMAHKREDMLVEMDLCKQLHHAHIVKFELVAECVLVQGAMHLAMVMEFVPVTLEYLIARRKAEGRPFKVARLAAIIGELASALHYLHAECGPPIVHGDIKPQNVCFHAAALAEDVASDTADNASVVALDDAVGADGADGGGGPAASGEMSGETGLRLIDFGAAVASAEPVHEFVGTLATVPPEMFAGEAYHTPADVWSMGMLIQWCLLLDNPMGEQTIPQWEACVSSTPAELPVFAPMPHQWPQELEPMAALARRCLAHNPAARPSAGQVQESCQAPSA